LWEKIVAFGIEVVFHVFWKCGELMREAWFCGLSFIMLICDLILLMPMPVVILEFVAGLTCAAAVDGVRAV